MTNSAVYMAFLVSTGAFSYVRGVLMTSYTESNESVFGHPNINTDILSFENI